MSTEFGVKKDDRFEDKDRRVGYVRVVRAVRVDEAHNRVLCENVGTKRQSWIAVHTLRSRFTKLPAEG